MNLPKGYNLDLAGATVRRLNLAGLGDPAAAPAVFRRAVVGPPVPGQPIVPVPERDVQATLQAVAELRGVLLWRNNTGAVRATNRAGKERLIRYGLGVGSPDLVGMLPSGRFLAVEAKRPGERPTAEQIQWLRRANAWGGVAVWCDLAATLESVLDNFLGPSGYMLAIDLRDDGSYDVVERQEVGR